MADAVIEVNGTNRDELYQKLLHVAKRKTAEADLKFDERGKAVAESAEEEFGSNVLIVERDPEKIFTEQLEQLAAKADSPSQTTTEQ